MFERVKTALILVVLVLICMFSTKNPVPMIALMGLTVAIAAYEWEKLMLKVTRPYLYAVVVTVLALTGIFWPLIWPYLWSLAILIWINTIIWVKKYPVSTQWYSNQLQVIGAVLLVSAVVSIFALWKQSPWWLMYVFALVWGADSGAYFVGRVLGKHKLAPNVSPAKSMEGLVGGLLTTFIIVMVVAFSLLALDTVSLVYFVVLSLLTVGFSVQGDLFESMVKRKAGIKDSGHILPGHGGVLDRIDSLMAAAPVFALGLWIDHHLMHQHSLGGF